MADTVAQKSNGEQTTKQIKISEFYTESTTTIEERTSGSASSETKVKKQKKKTRKEEKENISVKGSFSKFDALQKKNQVIENASTEPLCKACNTIVFQMEQIMAARAVWHKNCFRCSDCQKPLNVDTYESNEGMLYCKPHFKALFAPKAVVDEEPNNQRKQRRNELIIRENQPEELPPDVVRASQTPDLGLEELQNLDVKKRFEMFEHYQTTKQEEEQRTVETATVKKSPSILSKLARFQQRGDGQDRGVVLSDDEHPASEDDEDDDDEDVDGDEDPELVRARKLGKKSQQQQIFHFQEMSDVKNRWERMGNGQQEEDLKKKEGRKQEIQSIRSRLFMGKREKMADLYQQAVQDSTEGKTKNKVEEIGGDFDAKAIKERFERGEVGGKIVSSKTEEANEEEVYESEMSKNSRTLFLELDANSTKPPQLSPMAPAPSRHENRKAREVFLAKTAPENRVRSVDEADDGVEIRTADIQERFKFFEHFKPETEQRKQFRMTPPRDDQPKQDAEEEVEPQPEVEEDFLVAEKTHTATKMLSKFRQMEENLQKPAEPLAPKPLKQFTPPPTPPPQEESSSGEDDEDDDEDEQDNGANNVGQNGDGLDLTDRAKKLREKFEKWETKEKMREKERESFLFIQDDDENQSQVESTKSLRARFENLTDSQSKDIRPTQPKIKVNRFL